MLLPLVALAAMVGAARADRVTCGCENGPDGFPTADPFGLERARQVSRVQADNVVSPAAPRVAGAVMTVAEAPSSSLPIVDLRLDATFSPDTAALRIDVIGPGGQRWTAYTPPDAIRRLGKPICNTEIPFVQLGQMLNIELRAVDASGVESAPVATPVIVVRGLDRDACARPHWRCGTGDMALLMFGALAIAGLVVVALVIAICRSVRRVDPALGPPAPISLLVVELAARALQRRGGVIAAIGLAGVPWLISVDHELAAIPVTILACIGVRGYAIARGVLRRIERGAGAVTAELRGHTIHLHDASDGAEIETQLEVAPRVLARARKRAVPVARQS